MCVDHSSQLESARRRFILLARGTLLARRKVVQEAAVHLRQSGAFRSVTVVAILDRVLDSLVRQNLRVLD